MNGWNVVATIVNLISRLPIGHLVVRSDTRELEKLGVRFKEINKVSVPPPTTGQSDWHTLKYQLDLLLDDLQHLETEHLPDVSKSFVMEGPDN